MRIVVLAIVGAIVVGGGLYYTVLQLSAGSREAARSFVLTATAGAYAEARSVMHPELASQFPDEALAEMFGTTAPYVEVGFSSMSYENGSARLSGTARTAEGCSSVVAFTLLNEEIVAFNITPLCRMAGSGGLAPETSNAPILR